MRARVLLGLAVVVLCLLAVGRFVWKRMPPFERGVHEVIEAQTDHARTDAPRIGNCPVFPPDNVWNTPVDTLQKDRRAGDYVDSIGPLHKMHPDFGSNLNAGLPYTFIPAGTRPTSVTFEYRDDSDLGNYPIPPDAPIEGGSGSDGDRHVLLIDQRRCILYELFAAHPQPDGSWTAGSGVKVDLTGNQLRGDGKTSADASGLPIFPGLVRYDEVASGTINHALRFTIPRTQSAYVWPARHKASNNADPTFPPMGMRFRLRADFDISKFSKQNQVIMTALKRYGMFLADNGGAMFLSGVSDKRWDDRDLRQLGAMTAEDFEAVDESNWQMLSDSARVDPVALKQ